MEPKDMILPGRHSRKDEAIQTRIKNGPLFMLISNEYWHFLSGADFLRFFISSHFIYYQGEGT